MPETFPRFDGKDAPADITVTVTTLNQPATLHWQHAEVAADQFESGWAALTLAAWAIHLHLRVPDRIVLENGDEVTSEQIQEEYERMAARGDFGA